MANTPALYPGSAPTNDAASGTIDWINPDRAQTVNGSGATVSLASKQQSKYLKCVNFLPAIPGTATIGNVVVEVLGKITSSSGTPTHGFTLVDNTGGIIGASAFDNCTFGGTFGYLSLTLDASARTPTELNGALSGVAYKAVASNGGTLAVEVDTLRVTYYYTLAPAGSINLLLMGVGSILAAASAWLGYLPWLRSKLWHAGYWLKGGQWITCTKGIA